MGKLRHRAVMPQAVVGGSAVSVPRPSLRSGTDRHRLVLPKTSSTGHVLLDSRRVSNRWRFVWVGKGDSVP